MPKGILFHGPPGTGKTLAAKAVANESGARFYAQSASAFVEMFAGLGAARIRKLFEEARKNAPSIVFIDELDAVGQARSGHGFNREQDQTLNQLLVELDGFGPRDQVVVMGASNRLQDLDPALLRPGRFDRQILIQPPDLKGRRAILDVHTRGKPLADDVDLDAVARQTAGLTGADLANICNEAAIARRPQRPHDADARRTSTTRSSASSPGCSSGASSPTRRSASSPTTKAATRSSSHLVGNAAARRRRSSRAAPRSATCCTCPEEERYLETKEELLDWMVMALAGRAAEQLVFGRVTNGAANDLEKVTQIARAMVFEWGMGESRHLAHDARRQLRALRGDEAAARHRAGAAHRPRLRRGAAAAREAPRRARPHRGRAAREGDARRARSSSSSSSASSPSRAPPTRSASSARSAQTRRVSLCASCRARLADPDGAARAASVRATADLESLLRDLLRAGGVVRWLYDEVRDASTRAREMLARQDRRRGRLTRRGRLAGRGG